MNRREFLSTTIASGAIGTMIGYYVGARELLGIQSPDGSAPSTAYTTTETLGPDTSTETPAARSIVDGFESGAYDDGSPVEWQIKSPGEFIRVQSNEVKTGQHSLVARSGEDNDNWAQLYQHTESRELRDGDQYQFWIRPAYRAYYSLRPRLNSRTQEIQVRARADHSELVVRTFDRDGNQLDRRDLGDSDADNWYRFNLEMQPSNSEVIGRVYDTNTTLLGEGPVTLPDQTSYSYIVLEVPTPFGDQVTGWYDDITILSTDKN